MKVLNEQKHISTKCGSKKKKTTKIQRLEVVLLVFRFEQDGNPKGSLEELFFFFFFQFECKLKH